MTPQVPEYLVTFEAALRPLLLAFPLASIGWSPPHRRICGVTYGPGASSLCSSSPGGAQYLGSANAYFAISENAVPTVLFGLLIPLMVAAAGVRLSRRIASLVSAIPLPWFVAAQVYRVGGGIFLVLWADGRLPWQFALPAGIGDVTTGCLPSSWQRCWRKSRLAL